MANANALIKKQDGLLNKYAPLSDRVVYKRVITRTGGDSLIGRPASVTYTDTVLTPQPYFVRAGKRNVVVDNTRFQDVVTGSGTHTIEVFEALLSITAISEAEMKNPDVVLVFKYRDNSEETVFIDDYDPIAENQTVISWQARLKSIKRP